MWNPSHYEQPPASTIPLHLFFFLSILFAFVGMTWYANYESIFEGFFDQLKLVLMVSPLLLLLAVHLMTKLEKPSWFFFALPEQDSIHRVGSTPWGVGLLLVLLFFMISYRSDFRERWFPLLS